MAKLKGVSKAGGHQRVNQKNKIASKIKKNAIKKKTNSLSVLDARQRLIQKSKKKLEIRNFKDARDKLAVMAKGTDARKTLEKIRNLKQGKFDVKTTKKGGITIVTTTKGELQLTTKRKELASQKKGQAKGQQSNVKVSKIGQNLTKSVNQAGKISLSTKPKNSALNNSKDAKNQNQNGGATNRNRKSQSRGPKGSSGPLTKTIKGNMSREALLDEELMNTHVDPVVIRRTVHQTSYDRAPLSSYRPAARMDRSRSRSPIRVRDYDYDRPRYHFDDPRSYSREDELLRQRIREEEVAAQRPVATAGVKLLVQNLKASVSQEDLSELFGDVGPLKRVRMIGESSAEVLFLSEEDADRAIEVYHNRQLDGQPMKCVIQTSGSAPVVRPTGALRLPPSAPSSRSRYDEDPRPGGVDISSVHKALFSDRKRPPQGSAVPYASGSAPTKRSVSPDKARGSSQKFAVVIPNRNRNEQSRPERREQPRYAPGQRRRR